MPAVPSPGRSEAIDEAADTDRDGIPDTWETEHGLDPALASDAAEDSDGDGAHHLHEYLANTDPRDGTSVLKLILTATDGGLVLRFQATARGEHRLEAGSAAFGSWNVVTQYSRAETAMERSLTLAPTTARQWFRVLVSGAP